VFLVEDKRHGTTYLVFTWVDPRKQGYKGNVEDGVSLDYDMEAVHRWPDGEAAPEACVGRAPENPKHYKVFKYSSDRHAAAYQPVAGEAVVFGTWNDYEKLHLFPPDPDRTDDEPWYAYLDKLDEDSRRRRQRAQAPAQPTGKSRGDVAEWVAKRHLIADSAIQEVMYLPDGAPPDEIRFLERNDRLAGNGSEAEPIDFGLDIEGVSFRLFVADVTSEQLEEIKQDPSRLPSGWSLEHNRIWRRGA
jgi:hypothetical protein